MERNLDPFYVLFLMSLHAQECRSSMDHLLHVSILQFVSIALDLDSFSMQGNAQSLPPSTLHLIGLLKCYARINKTFLLRPRILDTILSAHNGRTP